MFRTALLWSALLPVTTSLLSQAPLTRDDEDGAALYGERCATCHGTDGKGLDRVDGRVILARPFTDTTWAREIGPDQRPIVLNDGSQGCLPDQWGGTNFNPPSFEAASGLFFVTARETCAVYAPQAPKIEPGRSAFGGTVRVDRDKAYGALRAIDAATGRRVWEFRYPSATMAGVLTTASGLVFAGDHEGNFMAFDGRTGKHLWRYSTGAPIWGAAAMTYLLDGRQHVVIASGTTLLAFALP
ncbi:MAG: outer membrane protein assembly factor BamB family protein [Acidobacteriota bacterium]